LPAESRQSDLAPLPESLWVLGSKKKAVSVSGGSDGTPLDHTEKDEYSHPTEFARIPGLDTSLNPSSHFDFDANPYLWLYGYLENHP
jgi:hypothetical protein